jgi:ferredoxin-fold anticodon binding domain-containing protein
MDSQAVKDNEDLTGAEKAAQIEKYNSLEIQAMSNHQANVKQLTQKHNEEITSLTAQEDKAEAQYALRLERLKSSLTAEKEILAAHAKSKLEVNNGERTKEEAAEMAANEAANARLTANHENLLAKLELDKQAILANKMLTEEEKTALQLEYDELEVAAKETHDQKMLAQAQKTADSMVKIKEMEEAAKRAAVSGAFKNISQLMNTESRKLFEIGKAAALANATVTGYDAAVTNFAQGSKIGGPPVGAAFAAASLVATFAQIKSIQSTQFGSKGAGQSVQGGQVSTNTGGGVGPQQASRNVSISLTGDNFGSGGIRGLIDEINEAVGDGVNVFASGG